MSTNIFLGFLFKKIIILNQIKSKHRFESIFFTQTLIKKWIQIYVLILFNEYFLQKNKSNIRYSSKKLKNNFLKPNKYIFFFKKKYFLIYITHLKEKQKKDLSKQLYNKKVIVNQLMNQLEIYYNKLNFTNKEFTFCLRVYIGFIANIQVGDKITGRYGNKGIVTKFIKDYDSFFLPDGTTVDIFLNPLGMPSRMNIGQIFECILGLIYEKMNKRLYLLPFSKAYKVNLTKMLIIQKLKTISLKKKLTWLYNISSIGKIKVKDGRTGFQIDNPIVVGISYILKLIHMVQDKLQSRNIGRYSMTLEQPIHSKDLNGGQRFGFMEVWALEAHGCSYTIQEILAFNADTILNKRSKHKESIYKKLKVKHLPNITDSFLLLIRRFNIMGFDFYFKNIILSKKNPIQYTVLGSNFFDKIQSMFINKSRKV